MSAPFRPKTFFIRATLCFFLVAFLCPVAVAQVVYQIEAAAAEFEFFEGRYGDALFRIDEALDWLSEAENRKLLIAKGEDYSVLEGLGLGLKAQIQAALGEVDRAKPLIARATKKLESRRTYYIRLGEDATNFWLSEAFLDYAQGDIEYDQYTPRDFRKFPCLPKELLGDGKDDKRLERCRKYYVKALRTLEHVQKGGGVAAPVAKGDNRFWDDHTSLSANLLMRIGRILTLEADREDQAARRRMVLTQAKSMYEQSEQRLRTLSSYDDAINPNTKFPVSLKVFETLKKDNKHVASGFFDDWKHDYARVVIHWIYHRCDWAELTAFLINDIEDNGEREKMVSDIDDTYNKIADLCEENFRKQHPIYHSVKVSQAKFFLALAREAEARVKQLEADGAAGKALDREKNKAKAHRMNSEFKVDGARVLIRKQLSIRHPLLLRASLLQLEMIREDDPDRDKKIAELCNEIKEIVAQRAKDRGDQEAAGDKL